jgi:single-stranded DNA-binding protein
MRTFAKFEIIGRVGSVNSKDKVTHVAIAANHRFRNAANEWVDEPWWNRVTVFSEHDRRFIADKVRTGELVRVVGRMRDNDYEKDGQRIFTVDRIVDEFDRLAGRGDSD